MYRKIIIFLFLLFLFLTGMEKTYDFFLLKNVNLKSSYVSTHRIDSDVLFLGPCESLWMMDPKVFMKNTGLKAFNLSTVHANFAENDAMLYLYLKKNKAPKFLFVYVSTESMDGKFNVFNTYNFPQYLNDPYISKIVQSGDSVFKIYSLLPFMKYAYYNTNVNFNFIQGIKHFLTKRTIPYSDNGYVHPHGIVWDNRLEGFAVEFPKGKKFAWNLSEEKSLLSLVRQAQKSGTRVIFYESPMLNEIKPFILNREEIKNKISKFALENKVPYWVFDTMRISNSREYFFSILNTNDRGTAIFNKIFSDYFIAWKRENEMIRKKYTRATQVFEKSGCERFGITETKQIYIRKPAKLQYNN